MSQALPRTISIGFDLQSITELESKTGLLGSSAVFTAAERARAGGAADPAASLTGIFSAKEAFIKAADALVGAPPYRLTDIEVQHAGSGRPEIAARGRLGEHFDESGLHVAVSISHSGGIAGAVVVIWTGT